MVLKIIVILVIVAMGRQVFAFGCNMCSGRFRAYRVSPKAQGAPPCVPVIVSYSTRKALKTSPEELTSPRMRAHMSGA